MCVLDRVYQKNATVVTRKVGDEVIIVPTEQQEEISESVFALNNMAAGIWVQIDGTTPTRTIKERILDNFEVSSEQAERELVDFLLQLEESHLISFQSTQTTPTQ